MPTNDRTVTIPLATLRRLLNATANLIEECESNADFGDTQGRGHASEVEALTEAEDALAAVRNAL